MKEIKVLVPGTIDERRLFELLMYPERIPDDVYVDMHDGLMPARRFFAECNEILGQAIGLSGQ